MSLYPVTLLNEQQQDDASQIVSNRTFFCQLCLQLYQFRQVARGTFIYFMVLPSGGCYFCNSATIAGLRLHPSICLASEASFSLDYL